MNTTIAGGVSKPPAECDQFTTRAIGKAYFVPLSHFEPGQKECGPGAGPMASTTAERTVFRHLFGTNPEIGDGENIHTEYHEYNILIGHKCDW